MGIRPANATRSRQAALPQEQLFDTHPEVSLDFETVRQAARQKYTRPFLILDTRIVREKTRRFCAVMPRVRPHYAVKANPDRRVLKVLAQEAAGFEIASVAELPAVYAAIGEELRSRYLLAYQSSNSDGAEGFRAVEVKLARPGLNATAMRGYYP